MFHYFVGKITSYAGTCILQNDSFGNQVMYLGNKAEGEFFLYPHLDDKKKTIQYFAFDTIEQQQLFESLIKINGIGTKTAMLISGYDAQELKNAVQAMDTKFFQSIPGIGPKSAKKLILELKDHIDLKQISAMDIDQKLSKTIIKSLKGLGYETKQIKETLGKYQGNITEQNMGEVIKRVIGMM